MSKQSLNSILISHFHKKNPPFSEGLKDVSLFIHCLPNYTRAYASVNILNDPHQIIS